MVGAFTIKYTRKIHYNLNTIIAKSILLKQRLVERQKQISLRAVLRWQFVHCLQWFAIVHVFQQTQFCATQLIHDINIIQLTDKSTKLSLYLKLFEELKMYSILSNKKITKIA